MHTDNAPVVSFQAPWSNSRESVLYCARNCRVSLISLSLSTTQDSGSYLVPYGVMIPNRIFVGGVSYTVSPCCTRRESHEKSTLSICHMPIHVHIIVSPSLSHSLSLLPLLMINLDDGSRAQGILLAVWESEGQ